MSGEVHEHINGAGPPTADALAGHVFIIGEDDDETWFEDQGARVHFVAYQDNEISTEHFDIPGYSLRGQSVTIMDSCGELDSHIGRAWVRKLIWALKPLAFTVRVQCDANYGTAMEAADGAIDDDEWLSQVDGIDREDFEPATALPEVNAAKLLLKPVSARQWHVEGLVPHRTVTVLSGDGGTGKSLIATQLGVATAARRRWLGRDVEPGRVAYFCCEDDLDEVHRRLANIVRELMLEPDALQDFTIMPMAGRDALLGHPKRGDVLQATKLFEVLKGRLKSLRPRLLILDNLADIFGGDENARGLARQFVSLIRGLAIDLDCTVMMLSHPSLSGMASGRGASGSTAWVNSVRSWLYLERVRGDDGAEVDEDIRSLKTTKANYGRTGGQITVRWQNGVFAHAEEATEIWIEKAAAMAKAEAIFIELLRAYENQGRHVSDKKGPNYAPAIFAAEERAKGFTSNALMDAMNRLFNANRISLKTVGKGTRAKDVLTLSEKGTKE